MNDQQRTTYWWKRATKAETTITDLQRHIDQMHKQMLDLSETEGNKLEATRAVLADQKAWYVSQWWQSKKDGDKATEALYAGRILEIDQALLQKNWIELKWEAEGR